MEHASNERAGNCFDFLRLFAALSVVVAHMVRVFPVTFLWVRADTQWYFWDGVPLFFVISGFLVYRSCEKCFSRGRPLRQYFTNRFLRVAPAIYAYSIAVVVLLWVIGDSAFPLLATKRFVLWCLSEVVLVPDFDPAIAHRFGEHGHLNPSLWTIPAEVSFYLLVPLLFLVERRFGFRVLMLSIVGIAGAGLLCTHYLYLHPTNVFGMDLNFFYFNMPPWLDHRPPAAVVHSAVIHAATINRTPVHVIRHVVPATGYMGLGYSLIELTFLPYLALFGLGIFWNRMWVHARREGWIFAVCLSVYVLIRIGNVFHVVVYTNHGPLFFLTWAFPFSYCIIWVAYHGPRLLVEIPRRVGDLSYGLYVWHLIVIYTIAYYISPKQAVASPVAVQCLVFGGSLAVALASWWAIERPCLRLKPFTSRMEDTRVVDVGAPHPAAAALVGDPGTVT